MAKRELSQAEQEYNRELQRIKRFIKNAEKRGFRFEADIVPARPQKITQASVSKLAKITPTKLYSKSTTVNERGEIVSGTEAIKQQRRVTRKPTKIESATVEPIKAPQISNEAGVEKAISMKDAETIQKMIDKQYTPADKNPYHEGYIAYQHILRRIDEVNVNYPHCAHRCQMYLEDDIATYGFEISMKNIGQAPDFFIEQCEIILYYAYADDDEEVLQAAEKLAMLIKGEMLTAEESKQMQDDFTTDVENNGN